MSHSVFEYHWNLLVGELSRTNVLRMLPIHGEASHRAVHELMLSKARDLPKGFRSWRDYHSKSDTNCLYPYTAAVCPTATHLCCDCTANGRPLRSVWLYRRIMRRIDGVSPQFCRAITTYFSTPVPLRRS